MFDLETFSDTDFADLYNGPHMKITGEHANSQIFLRVRARPDFISHLHEVMRTVPVVKFELILDPLLFGLIPRSLIGIVALVAITALVSYKIVAPKLLQTIEEIIRGKRQKMVRIQS